MGAVDEANAVLGLLRLHTAAEPEVDPLLGRIQNELFDLGADLCVPGEGGARLRLAAAQSARLEQEIASLNAALPALRSFVMPGGTPAAALAHLARTATRRAERVTVALAAAETVNPETVRYLNRLSDLLFVLSRVANGKGAATCCGFRARGPNLRIRSRATDSPPTRYPSLQVGMGRAATLTRN